jgi:hypothetical protein
MIWAATFLAAEGVDLNAVYGLILQSGLAGAFLILFLFGLIRRGSEVEAMRLERDQERAANKEMVDHYQTEVIPNLIKTTQVAGEMVAYLNKHRD